MSNFIPKEIKPYEFPIIVSLSAWLLTFVYLYTVKVIDPTFLLNYGTIGEPLIRTGMQIFLYAFIPTFLLTIIVQYLTGIKMYYMIENLVVIIVVLVETLYFFNFASDLSFIPILSFASIYYFKDIVKQKGGLINR